MTIPDREPALQIDHDPAASRFVVVVDGHLCRADYARAGDVLQVFHTEVPPALQGRGIAARLVRAVFEHAQEENLRVLPVCSYVSAWARRHPEVRGLLASR